MHVNHNARKRALEIELEPTMPAADWDARILGQAKRLLDGLERGLHGLDEGLWLGVALVHAPTSCTRWPNSSSNWSR